MAELGRNYIYLYLLANCPIFACPVGFGMSVVFVLYLELVNLGILPVHIWCKLLLTFSNQYLSLFPF